MWKLSPLNHAVCVCVFAHVNFFLHIFTENHLNHMQMPAWGWGFCGGGGGGCFTQLAI